MYTQIISKSEYNDGKGKRTWVNSNIQSVKVVTETPNHLGNEKWYLELEATTYLEINSGELGGEYRAVNRDLKIQLTEKDLSHIVGFLDGKGLLETSIAGLPR